MQSTHVADSRRARELDSLRIVALARLGVATVMIVAAYVGLRPKWPEYVWVPWLYGAAAVLAAVFVLTPMNRKPLVPRMQWAFVVLDVATIFTFKVVSPDGSYVPLLTMMLLPIMVLLEVSWQRASAALTVIAVTFAAEVYTDPVMLAQVGRARMALATVVFVFLCFMAWLVVYAQARRLDEISRLSASRQELLVDTMTAADEQQRKISEFIHDGPLQSVLMARQDIVGALKKGPDEALERALSGLREATEQMREATFELHPAVLAGAGLARAVQQLATASSARSGIDIGTDIDYPRSDAVDPIVFAVTRELLSNVVRHSKATRATVRLKAAGAECRLDVIDDGIGMSAEQAARQLANGHIGLASQRVRVEAAEGTLRIAPSASGAHVVVTVPMAGPAQPDSPAGGPTPLRTRSPARSPRRPRWPGR